MTKSIRIRRRPLGLGEQVAWFRQSQFKDWDVHRRPGGLIAHGTVQPSALSVNYKMRLQYRNFVPKVEVLEPPLKLREDAKRIPHTYSDGSLCLYLPKVGDWTKEMPLARTVVPWIAEWLYFYELWLVTGEWLGGGIHPGEI